ncbi:hypothetical protein [Sinomonas mesophila]|uniref:hypothetical protein n=1 Tax=Sinomonas mesophila TaxID=1531955 RepID=UPI001115987A|nr:hypothetical protein [Sinomonas mesophila]
MAAALGLMVIVPMTALDDRRPAPFGWHMYAGSIDAPEIEVTTDDGTVEPRNTTEIVARFRPEPDYLEPLARFICAREEPVQSVRLTRGYPPADQEFRCSSL